MKGRSHHTFRERALNYSSAAQTVFVFITAGGSGAGTRRSEEAFLKALFAMKRDVSLGGGAKNVCTLLVAST
jgi:hypothetical protein